jgi:hypothetical protein
MNSPLKRLPAWFYRSDSGREPVREWLKELDLEDRRRIGEDIKDVEFAWPIGMTARTVASKRAMGSSESLTARTDSPRYFLRRAGLLGAASRVHEENPKDAATRHRPGA